jgi:hypothetical protein
MRVLVACEYSGMVRDAFVRAGHYALSCDLLPSEQPGEHYQGDIMDILDDEWDLMIAHPPCTHLAVSGARWFKDKQVEQAEALDFVRLLLDAPIPKIALENPVSIISSRIRKPDQIIQPYEYGHEATKTTCLWLKNLPPFLPILLARVNGTLPKAERVFPNGITCRLPLIAGRSDQRHSQALRKQWQINGVAWESNNLLTINNKTD